MNDQPREGWVIQSNIEVHRWLRGTEVVDGFLVRDSDLPFVEQYYRVAPRVYLTTERQLASVWIYEQAAETYLTKHNLYGALVRVDALATGGTTSDGRKQFVPA